MSFLKRIKLMITGLFEKQLQNSELNNHDAISEGMIKDYENKMMSLKKSMTKIIFHRKKLEHRNNLVEEELTSLKSSFESAVSAKREELALQIIGKIELLKEERTFLTAEIEKVATEIKSTSESEKLLSEKIVQAKGKLAVLGSRIESLKLKREIQSDLNSFKEKMVNVNPEKGIGKITDQVLKLEAELEGQSDELEFDTQINTLEREEKNKKNRELLEQYKKQMLQKTDLFKSNVVTVNS